MGTGGGADRDWEMRVVAYFDLDIDYAIGGAADQPSRHLTARRRRLELVTADQDFPAALVTGDLVGRRVRITVLD